MRRFRIGAALLTTCWPVLADAEAGGITPQQAQAWLAALPAVLLALAAAGVALTGVVLVWRAFAPGSEEGFSLRLQVGGFGAPGRGWRLSTPLVQMLAGLALVALAVALGLARAPSEVESKDAAKPSAPNAKTELTAAEPAASSAASAASR